MELRRFGDTVLDWSKVYAAQAESEPDEGDDFLIVIRVDAPHLKEEEGVPLRGKAASKAWGELKADKRFVFVGADKKTAIHRDLVCFATISKKEGTGLVVFELGDDRYATLRLLAYEGETLFPHLGSAPK